MAQVTDFQIFDGHIPAAMQTVIDRCRQQNMENLLGGGKPGVPEEFAKAVKWAWDPSAETARMGRQPGPEYESKYTATRNYPPLIEAYESAIRRARQPGHAAQPR